MVAGDYRPITVAGPRRIRTGLPFEPRALN